MKHLSRFYYYCASPFAVSGQPYNRGVIPSHMSTTSRWGSMQGHRIGPLTTTCATTPAIRDPICCLCCMIMPLLLTSSLAGIYWENTKRGVSQQSVPPDHPHTPSYFHTNNSHGLVTVLLPIHVGIKDVVGGAGCGERLRRHGSGRSVIHAVRSSRSIKQASRRRQNLAELNRASC